MATTDKDYRVLIVEDAESILLAIRDYLVTYFNIEAVATAQDAEKLINQAVKDETPFDLMVADIHLPDKTGLDLIKYLREHSPSSKAVLMTSYDINDYIEFIQENNIDQVLSKHSHFSLHDLYVTAYKTMTSNIFGLDKYFEDIKVYYPPEMKNNLVPGNKEAFSVKIRSSEERIYWTDKISQILFDLKKVPESLTKLVLDEITTNAMVRAPQFEDGTYKYQTKIPGSDVLVPQDEIVLEPEDYFLVQYGFYDDWIIITCQDPHGNLHKQEILYRLKRHISISTDSGLPDGLSDSHGRGIFLLREHLTHLIFNIQRNRKTEVICLFNTSQDVPYKNISIYETL